MSLLGKNPTVFALRNIKAAILYIMEGEKDLVLEIGISDLVPALNGFLKDLAADMNSTSKAREG